MSASHRLLPVVGIVVLAPLSLWGCGDDDASSEETVSVATPAPGASDTPGDDSDATTIVIEGFAYQVPLEVPAGVTITVRNDDQATHTVTADDGSFAVEVAGGETVTFSGPSAGSYAFHCEIHASMTGELQVA